MKALKYESERSRQTSLRRLAGFATLLLLSAPAQLLKARPANERPDGKKASLGKWRR